MIYDQLLSDYLKLQLTQRKGLMILIQSSDRSLATQPHLRPYAMSCGHMTVFCNGFAKKI